MRDRPMMAILALPAVLLGIALLAGSARAQQPRRWVIVEERAAGAAGLAFLSNFEGHERARAAQGGQPATTFQIGGNFTNFLGNVGNGDELVVIAHGWIIRNQQGQTQRFGFRWNGQTFIGFGAGQDEMAVPNGFNQLMNVRATIGACYSARDPDGAGAETALTEKLLAAMGPAGNNNAVTGFQNSCQAGVHGTGGPGGTNPQRRNAMQALQQNGQNWGRHPPANRPNTGGQNQPANQQTAAQAIVDNAIGAGVFAYTIPNVIGQRAQGQQQAQPGYYPPFEGAAPPAAGLPHVAGSPSDPIEVVVDACIDTCSGEGCGVGSVFVEDVTLVDVEAVSAWFEATSDGVDLVWILGGAAVERLILRRRTVDEPWRTVWETHAGSARVAFHDAAVIPGQRYGYLLVAVEGGSERVLNEIWLDVPFAMPRILAAWAGGDGASVTARISLPSARRARLEVWDVQGRRLTRQDVASAVPGIQEVRLALPARAASTLVFVRLVQNDLSDAARVLLLH